jgi:hypothetical protein
MVVINSKTFRDKQNAYLDLIDKEEQVIVKRGKSKVYIMLNLAHYSLFTPYGSLPRQGWEDAAKQMHASGDDAPLMPDVFDDENLNGWTW